MVITVVSNKGGVGKSTTAIHLAKYIARHQGPVTLVDGDDNGTSLIWHRTSQENDFLVVPPSVTVSTKHVVIDAQARPPKEDLDELAKISDLAIVPCIPTAFSISGTVTFLRNHPFKKCGVLLTMCDPQGSDWKDAREAFEAIGVRVFDARIQRRAAYKKAEVVGLTVADLKKDSYATRAWGDYVAFGEELFHE